LLRDDAKMARMSRNICP